MRFVLIILSFIILSTKCVSVDRVQSMKDNDRYETILETISVDDFYKMIQENKNNSNVIIIDFRTEAEYNSGYIENSINIDFYVENLTEILNQLDKNKTYFIYCRSGNRSGRALKIMEDLEFKRVYNMEGGIILWHSKGYPVVYK